jgi:outer membrane protein OmpA-like peptidoglycan-associated protein
MNSKSVILLGLLASLLLIALCVFFNAERYYKELGLSRESKEVMPLENTLDENKEAVSVLSETDDTIAETKDEDRVETISVEKKEESSSFNYYLENNKTFISGNIPLLDNGDVFKELIADCSKDKSCENNVTFLDNGETLSWKNFASSVLTIFRKEKIVDPKLSIDKKDIKIEGEFLDQSGKEQLSILVNKHKGEYIISDLTSVKVVPKEEPKKVKEENNESKHRVSVADRSGKTPNVKTPKNISEKNLDEEQKKISTLLKNNRITFKRNSGKIRKEGRRVLDKIVKLLKGKESILIEVEGYTDAGGKEKINLWISEERAKSVKKYLIQKGIKADKITAKGFGESKFLLPKKPYDPLNRRVEIHLKRR